MEKEEDKEATIESLERDVEVRFLSRFVFFLFSSGAVPASFEA